MSAYTIPPTPMAVKPPASDRALSTESSHIKPTADFPYSSTLERLGHVSLELCGKDRASTDSAHTYFCRVRHPLVIGI